VISQRTKAALAAAKARGQVLGNPRLDEARAVGNAIQKNEADAHAGAVMPAIREAQAAGAKYRVWGTASEHLAPAARRARHGGFKLSQNGWHATCLAVGRAWREDVE